MMYIMYSSCSFQVAIIMISQIYVHVHVSDNVHSYLTSLDIRFIVDHVSPFDGSVISVF